MAALAEREHVSTLHLAGKGRLLLLGPTLACWILAGSGLRWVDGWMDG